MYLSTPKQLSVIMQDGPLYVCDRQYDQANLLCYFLPQNSHHFYSDLDLACHFVADPDPTCHFVADAVRIRILPFIVMWIGIWFLILASKRKAKNLENVLNRLIFHTFWLVIRKLTNFADQLIILMRMCIRIRILTFISMRIQADPDP